MPGVKSSLSSCSFVPVLFRPRDQWPPDYSINGDDHKDHGYQANDCGIESALRCGLRYEKSKAFKLHLRHSECCILFYWYEVPCASPCQYASPNQLRINRRQHHLPEISGSGDPIGLRCFFDIIRYLVNPSNYCERHRPDHCRKDQDYRSKLLSALAGDSGQDENKDRRKEA